MALNRTTSSSLSVRRRQGKIALEEAVGSPYFNATSTLPEAKLITNYDGGLPFSQAFAEDVKHRLEDIPARLNSMAQSGIQYQIVSLTSPGIEGIADAKTAIELARETNDHIHASYVQAHPNQFGFFACVSMQDPVAAAAELERAVTQLGAKGVLINGYSNINAQDWNEVQYLDDPKCEPFWAKLSELNVPLYLHPRNPPPDQQRLYWGYPLLAQSAYSFGAETAGHALRIFCSGILDEYPHIQILLGHAAEALTFLIHRIYNRLSIGRELGASGPYKQTMVHYLTHNVYATLAGITSTSTLQQTMAELGEARTMFSVDYPYESNEDAADWFDSLQLSDNTKNAIAFENAGKLFKL